MWNLLLFALSLGVCAGADPMTTLEQRIFDFYLDNGDCTQMAFCSPPSGGCAMTCDDANTFAATITLSNYTWSDIDYKDQTSSDWKTIVHLERVQTISQAWNCQYCSGNKDTLSNVGLGALRWWLNNNPTNPNWWWNDFGAPQYVGLALILFANITTSSDVSKGITILHQADSQFDDSGQNGVWAQQIGINRGLLEENETLVSQMFDLMWSQVNIEQTQDDGIQPDSTFYQHGSLVQNGAYGADSFLNLVVYTALADGLPYAITSSAMDTLSAYVLDGEQWTMRWNGDSKNALMWWDISVKGREIVRAPIGNQIVSTTPLIPAMTQISQSNIPRAKEWSAYADRMRGNGSHLVGTRHFWFGDFTTHHRTKFSISAKMLSTRTYNAESTNGEGMESWHLSDGVTLIYQNGSEYESIFPIWDWNALPGATLRQGVKDTPGNVKLKGQTTFVGGCVSQGSAGSYGISTMAFAANNYGDPSEKIPLTARKSWFWLDEGYVGLGANITLGSGSVPPQPMIATTLEQSILSSQVLVNGAALALNIEQTLTATTDTWVHHNNILYLPALTTSSNLTVRGGNQSGSWSEIDTDGNTTMVTGNVFKIQLLHGLTPSGGSYAYAALPSINSADAASAKANFQKSVVVVTNTGNVQAVQYQTSSELFLFASVFTASATSSGIGNSLAIANVSSPAAIVVRQSGSTVQISASDPNNQALSLTLLVNRQLSGSSSIGACTPGSGWSTVKLVLPSGLFAGNSSSITCASTLQEQIM